MELLSAIVSIVIIDMVMSGDNAVVIGMAAHSLPQRQRNMAILFGGASAVLLRVAITSIATVLLQIPVIKLIGGLLLVWIAFSLLKQEEEQHEHTRSVSGLRAAIQTIILADLIMSLDNSLAVAAVAHGDVPLLVFGLVLSMPIVMFTGTIVAELINRLWWLAYLGSALISWTGAEMVLEDGVVHGAVAGIDLLRWGFPVVTVVGIVSFSHWFHRRREKATEREPSAAAVLSDGSSDLPGA